MKTEIYNFKKENGIYFVDFDESSNFPIREETLIKFIKDQELNKFYNPEEISEVYPVNYLAENELEILKLFLSCVPIPNY